MEDGRGGRGWILKRSIIVGGWVKQFTTKLSAFLLSLRQLVQLVTAIDRRDISFEPEDLNKKYSSRIEGEA